MERRRARVSMRPLVVAGVVLGVGLGGFVDGIVLHQILQWHHMLSSQGDYPSSTVAGLEVNTLWDGLFQATTFVFTLVGVWLLFGAADRPDVPWSGRVLSGALLGGWGAFNLVEGVVNHHVLRVHHVREDAANVLAWDLGFLAFGAVLVAVGTVLVRSVVARRFVARGERDARGVAKARG